ncbi:MAG: DUF393 domain-containing protein [Gemmataceae bacterium]|nr:DUF393 domain-containing protein [Gemmataceae bacterium]MDW8264541.1 DUF393 domain-containing protein [Gemmataceae bacterium]
MNNGWTGGQYSIYRAVLAAAWTTTWAQHLIAEPPRGGVSETTASSFLGFVAHLRHSLSSPPIATVILATMIGLGLVLLIGWWDRWAAIVLGGMATIGVLQSEVELTSGFPPWSWLLLAHALTPPAPYGSWAARGRIDPAGGWQMPPRLFAAAWTLLSLSYLIAGGLKLADPAWRDGTALARLLTNAPNQSDLMTRLAATLPGTLWAVLTWSVLIAQLAFGPLALVRRARPWIWATLLSGHVGTLIVLGFDEITAGMVLAHLLTFDPGWVPGPSGATERIFYDGHCGLCHRAVRWVLAEDRGLTFRFAPLHGVTFVAEVAEDQRRQLPDSLVVRTSAGLLLTRAAAVRHIARRLGGLWRLLAEASRLVPVAVLDLGYRGVAAIRHRLFAPPPGVCPVLPPALRARFDP